MATISTFNERGHFTGRISKPDLKLSANMTIGANYIVGSYHSSEYCIIDNTVRLITELEKTKIDETPYGYEYNFKTEEYEQIKDQGTIDDFLSNQKKGHRRILLEQTDKPFSVSDFPISDEEKNNLKVYRQNLRDITSQEQYPYNVDWGIAPVIKKFTIEESVDKKEKQVIRKQTMFGV